MAMNEYDIDLVKSAKNGSTQAFEELYERYYGKIFALARMTVKNEADAEDILQQAFISAWRNMHSLTNPEAFSTWLQKITLNQCYALMRKKSIVILMDAENDTEDFAEDVSEDFLPAVYAERDDLRLRLGKIIDSLSEVQKQTIVLFYFNEQKVEEIAYIMECTVGTVKSRLFLARKAIRTEVEEEEQKSGEKFYGIAGIPMLSLGELLSQHLGMAALSGEISSGILAALTEAISQTAIAGVTASSTAIGSAVAGGGAAVSGTATATATTGLSASVKGIIIAVTVTAAVGLGVGGIFLANRPAPESEPEPAPVIITTPEPTPELTPSQTPKPTPAQTPKPTPTPTPLPSYVEELYDIINTPGSYLYLYIYMEDSTDDVTFVIAYGREQWVTVGLDGYLRNVDIKLNISYDKLEIHLPNASSQFYTLYNNMTGTYGNESLTWYFMDNSRND